MKCRVSISILGLVALAISGCTMRGGGSDDCQPDETRVCVCPEGESGTATCSSKGTSWGDCICNGDTPDSVATNDGTQVDGGPAGDVACEPSDLQFKRGCHEGAVFWFDDCGNKEDLIETCKLPEEACEEGLCVAGCAPWDHKGCEGNAVWWYDSCGNKGTLLESCGENTICSGDECVTSCTPHAEEFCLKNSIYWYDSCGNAETPAELCDADEFCIGCTVDDEDCDQAPSCVKGFFNGDWEFKADPDTKDACGLGNATYFDQVLQLEIGDGGNATGKIEVAGFNVDYTGTLDGKHLVLTGSYVQDPGTATEMAHEETIDVEFDSLSTLKGIHIDSFAFPILGPCTLYWDVTGTKK